MYLDQMYYTFIAGRSASATPLSFIYSNKTDFIPEKNLLFPCSSWDIPIRIQGSLLAVLGHHMKCQN